MSVSADEPFTHSDLFKAPYHAENSCSLMRCQTSEGWASMTADSRTEVEVGMAPDMFRDLVVRSSLLLEIEDWVVVVG